MKKTLAMGLCLVIFLTLVGCGPEGDVGAEENRPTVIVTEVKAEPLRVSKVYEAVLEIVDEQYISTQVAGYVQRFFCEEGEEVGPGNLVARLANPDISQAQARVNQESEIAQIQCEKIEARVEEGQKEVERNRLLYRGGMLAQVTLDKSVLEWEGLKQDLAQAQKQLALSLLKQEESRQDLDNCAVLAPDHLWIVEKMVKIGQFVSAGQPIFRTGKLNALTLNLEVPGDEAFTWQVGSTLEVESQGEIREGQIYNLNQIAYPGSGRTAVEIRVENAELDWHPGYMARVKFDQDLGEQILLPAEAILQGETPYVYLLRDDSVYRQKVTLGKVEGARVCVNGLENGCLVVTGGTHRLRDGQAVSLKEGP